MNKTALIIVDMVYDFTNKSGKVFYPRNEEIIEQLSNFIKIARKNNCLLVFVEHTVKQEDYLKAKHKMRECCIEGSGGELTDERLNCNREKDIIIKKTKYSSFYKTDLDTILEENDIQNLLITGTKTNNCIIATVFDAFYRDFNTYVVKDLVGTSDDLTNEIYLRDINKYLAKTMSSHEIAELLSKGEL